MKLLLNHIQKLNINKSLIIFFAFFPYLFSDFFSFSNYSLGFIVFVSFVLMPLFFIYQKIKLKSIIDISFWIYILVFIGYPFFFQLNNMNFPWLDYTPTEKEIFNAIIIFLIGIISFIFGRYFTKEHKLIVRRISFTKYNYMLVISLIMILYILFQIGFSSLFLPRVFYAQKIFGENLILPLFANLLEPIIAITIISSIYFLKIRKISLKKILFTFFIIFLFVNPIRSSRLEFFLPLLIIFLHVIKFNTQIWAFFLIIGLSVIFPTADIFRSFEINQNNAPLFYFNQTFTSGDFDGPAGNLISIIYLKSNPYFLGSNFMGALLGYVPRSLWPNKPFGTGYTVSNGIGLEYPNIGINMWAESYLSFGYLGVIIFFIFFGKLVYLLQLNYKKDFLSYILYVYFSCSMIFLLRGEVLQVGLRLIPLALISYIITYRNNKLSIIKRPQI